ncbi:MAG: 3-oxoacyl-[acyl-carrier-protein] reductase [Candidatus Omnitrophica bacterium]|nr:3-oxoacyl-[acyl-carrier-protein] reductase [Candidatus Omnitrophota bacterium]
MILKDKVAIVTGGARGIGREIALTLAREGSDLVIVDVDNQALTKIEEEIKELGRQILVFSVDVTALSQVEEMVNKTLDKLKKIDILINNAGITRDALLIRMKEEDWDKVLAVNLKGVFNCTKAVSKVMMKQRSGKIVSISSIIGLIGNVGQANYAASKAGIIGLTKSVAKELAPRGINVNAIAPGFIQTEMTASIPENIKAKMLERIPLGKFGQPQDVANLVMFLASEKASYITGQVITIDGGMV